MKTATKTLNVLQLIKEKTQKTKRLHEATLIQIKNK